MCSAEVYDSRRTIVCGAMLAAMAKIVEKDTPPTARKCAMENYSGRGYSRNIVVDRRESAVRTANGAACSAPVHIDTNKQTVRALGSSYTHSPSKACGLVTSWTKWLQPDAALAFRRAHARSAAYGRTDQCKSGPGRSHRRRCKRAEAHWSVSVHAR